MPYEKKQHIIKCIELLSTYYNHDTNDINHIIRYKLEVCRKMCGDNKKNCDDFMHSMKHVKKFKK